MVMGGCPAFVRGYNSAAFGFCEGAAMEGAGWLTRFGWA
jgi:hypothetical protein